MAKKKCPKCNTSNSSDATFCRHCGESLLVEWNKATNTSSSSSHRSSEGAKIFFGILYVCGIIGSIALFFADVIGKAIALPLALGCGYGLSHLDEL